MCVSGSGRGGPVYFLIRFIVAWFARKPRAKPSHHEAERTLSLEPIDHLNGPDPTKEEVAAKLRAWSPFIAALAVVVLVLLAADYI